MAHPVMASLNGSGMGTGVIDGSGTINPAALETTTTAPSITTQSSPRGVKRSRSPEEEGTPRKRGRPPKSKVPESPSSAAQAPPPPTASLAQTPHAKGQNLPQASPTQASPTQTSPTRATPTKGSVIKALPTVRDHTTDQLNQEGDEYIPREYDDAGEKKVTATGHLLDGREYRCRTFYVPGRGDKLFMLATECARVLGYRDSYLLFNKNRSLHKIIASQIEKDDLIHQEILPYSYRSRQIAIVTARSMFRQFGSRLIVNGRRVRDDYWESKARKQGFTEEDAAGEKRPGAAKAREAAAAAVANPSASLTSLPHGEVIYSNGPAVFDAQHGFGGIHPITLAPLPMINPIPTDDLRPRDYSNVQRPRHEISGLPYQDRTQSSSAAELLNQAAQTAEFNKALGQQRSSRGKYLDDYWKRPHESPVTATQRPDTAGAGDLPPPTQTLQSPQQPSAAGIMGSTQQGLAPLQQQGAAQMMAPQSYSQPTHPQNPLVQSPVRSMHPGIRPEQLHHRASSMSAGSVAGHTQPASYGYPTNPMWPPPQPQPSPLAQTHHAMQYSQHAQQHSPHPQQSPHHAPPPQLHHSQSSGSLHGTPMMAYQGMGSMGAAGYPNMGRAPYQPSPTPQQYMQQPTPPQQPGMQGWPQGPHGQQGWQGF